MTMQLATVLQAAQHDPRQQQSIFAWLVLGLVESLDHGTMSADEAVSSFFNAENGLFVRRHFTSKVPDRVMSHGVQLPDLLSILPREEAHRQFKRELDQIRSLCLKLIQTQPQTQ